MGILGNIGKPFAKVVANEVDRKVIRWPATDEERAVSNDIIAYRYPEEDFPNGAIVQVEHAQIAILYNEQGQEIVVPAGQHTIETLISQFKGVNELVNMNAGGKSENHNYLYFINLVKLTNLKFGTVAPIPIEDCELKKYKKDAAAIPISVRAFGIFNASIDGFTGEQAQNFMKSVVGSRPIFTKDDFVEQMLVEIQNILEANLGRIMAELEVGLLQVAAHYSSISNSVKEAITPKAAEYGVNINGVAISSINAPPEDMEIIKEEFRQLRAKDIEASGIDKISEAMAAKRAREGYTYQQERGFDVLGTAAANEATPGQFMGAGMGLGLGVGVGGAFGAAMGNMAQNTFNGMNYNQQGYYQQPNGYYPPNGYQQPNGQYAPNGYYQQPNGQYAPNGYQQQPNGQYVPNGYQQQPNGQYAPNGYCQQPNGQYAPNGYPQQPNGQYAPSGYPQQPNGQYAPNGYQQQPNGQYAPNGYQQQPNGYYQQPNGQPAPDGYPQQPNGQYAPDGQPAQTQEGQQQTAENGQPEQPQPQQGSAFKKCPVCGADIPQNAMFCMYCGNKLDKKEGE